MCPETEREAPVACADRLDEGTIADLIAAYRDGATAASLAAIHGVSLKSVKRQLHTAGIRRISSTQQITKAASTPHAAAEADRGE